MFKLAFLSYLTMFFSRQFFNFLFKKGDKFPPGDHGRKIRVEEWFLEKIQNG